MWCSQVHLANARLYSLLKPMQEFDNQSYVIFRSHMPLVEEVLDAELQLPALVLVYPRTEL